MHGVGIGGSHAGKVREQNEDVFFVDNDLGLYIVCDGMGGHAAGEVAARVTIDTVADRVRGDSAVIARVRQGEEHPFALQQLLEAAVHAACDAVYSAAVSQVGRAGMGSTLTALLVAGSRAAMAHVGDTRLYLVREGRVHQLTIDHTMVAELVRTGTMSLPEARQSPYAHTLTRAVGPQRAVVVDTLVLDLDVGDRFLLCSDGLTEYVEGQALAAPLLGEIESVPDALIGMANANGGRDNVTAIVVEIETDEEVAAGPAAQRRLEVLGGTFLGRELPLAQLQRIANRCELREHVPGDTLYREGDPADALVVILAGRATVMRGGQALGQIAGGDCAGVPFLLNDRAAAATVRTSEPTTCLWLTSARFRELAAKRPWLGVELFSRVGRWCSAALGRAALGAGALRPNEVV